jgi:hypothetical protein
LLACWLARSSVKIDVDDSFIVPADVAGGNNLFNVVVDTDATASRLLQLMNKYVDVAFSWVFSCLAQRYR